MAMLANGEALPSTDPFGEIFAEPKPLAERISDFNETLEGIKDVRIHHNLVLDFNLDDPVENANRFLRQQELLDSPHVPSRLYVRPNAITDIDEGPIDTIKFIHRISRLGQKSAHGVCFLAT